MPSPQAGSFTPPHAFHHTATAPGFKTVYARFAARIHTGSTVGTGGLNAAHSIFPSRWQPAGFPYGLVWCHCHLLNRQTPVTTFHRWWTEHCTPRTCCAVALSADTFHTALHHLPPAGAEHSTLLTTTAHRATPHPQLPPTAHHTHTDPGRQTRLSGVNGDRQASPFHSSRRRCCFQLRAVLFCRRIPTVFRTSTQTPDKPHSCSGVAAIHCHTMPYTLPTHTHTATYIGHLPQDPTLPHRTPHTVYTPPPRDCPHTAPLAPLPRLPCYPFLLGQHPTHHSAALVLLHYTCLHYRPIRMDGRPWWVWLL